MNIQNQQFENYTFRKANSKDLDSVFTIFQNAISNMISYGIDQWDQFYPDKETLFEDITKEQMTLILNKDAIVAVYVLNEKYDEEYTNGNWKYPNTHFCVIHRLCVNPEYQHKGIARLCIQHIEEECLKLGYEAIRMDSFTKNPFATKLYNNLNYTIVGQFEIRKGTFDLREKKL